MESINLRFSDLQDEFNMISIDMEGKYTDTTDSRLYNDDILVIYEFDVFLRDESSDEFYQIKDKEKVKYYFEKIGKELIKKELVKKGLSSNVQFHY